MSIQEWVEKFFKMMTCMPKAEKMISFGETRVSGIYVAVFETDDKENDMIANFNIEIDQEGKTSLTNIKVC